MSDLNRREAVRVVTGLALFASLNARRADAQEEPFGTPKPVTDPELAAAIREPQAFMFQEQVTFQLDAEDRWRELFVISARGPQGSLEKVRCPSSAIRIFRADAGQDDFTRQGGIYWRCHKTEGTIQFKKPGAIVMIVRDQEGTVRCYSLARDFRC